MRSDPRPHACRALGRHLHTDSQRLGLDVEQWKSHSAELTAQIEAERQQMISKQQEVDAQMVQIKELLETQARL
jgi:kinesin family protein C1